MKIMYIWMWPNLSHFITLPLPSPHQAPFAPKSFPLILLFSLICDYSLYVENWMRCKTNKLFHVCSQFPFLHSLFICPCVVIKLFVPSSNFQGSLLSKEGVSYMFAWSKCLPSMCMKRFSLSMLRTSGNPCRHEYSKQLLMFWNIYINILSRVS